MKRLGAVTALTMAISSGLVAVSAAQGAAAPPAGAGVDLADLGSAWAATLAAEEVAVLEQGPGATASAARLVKSPTALRNVAAQARERAELIRESVVSEGFAIEDAAVATAVQVVKRQGRLQVQIAATRSWVEVDEVTGAREQVGDTDLYVVEAASLEAARATSKSAPVSVQVAPVVESTEKKSDPVVSADAASTVARPASPRTEDGTAASTARTGLVAAATGDTNFDHEKFAAYGKKWTGSPYDGDEKSDFNPDYPYFGQNCANFVSQMFNAAGWKRTGGINPNDEENWDDNLTGPAGASDTWAGAASLYRYAYNVKKLNTLGNIWNAVPGNTYFMDWDGNNKINHVAAVTGRTDGGVPRISQKTKNRHNMLLTTWKAKVDADNPNVKWFGLRRTMR